MVESLNHLFEKISYSVLFDVDKELKSTTDFYTCKGITSPPNDVSHATLIKVDCIECPVVLLACALPNMEGTQTVVNIVNQRVVCKDSYNHII